MKTLKNARYNQDYSRPLTEAQKSVARDLYVPISLRGKIKTNDEEVTVEGHKAETTVVLARPSAGDDDKVKLEEYKAVEQA